VNRWTSNGPEGASVKLLVTDPSRSWIYAVSESGAVFRSTDNDGEPHWQRIAMQLSGAVITALAIDSGIPDALYAGTAAGEVFRSGDRGDHWVEVEMPDLGSITSIVVDDDRNRIYMTMKSGLVISHDEGRSWRVATQSVRAPLTVTADGSVYAVDTTSSLLHVSTDGGNTWTRTMTSTGTVSVLAFSRQTSTLYVGHDVGMWASSDKGNTWRILPYLDRRLLSLHATGSRVFAITSHGLYEYTAGSPAWEIAAPNTPSVTAFTAGPYSGRLYLGTKAGILTADDGSVDWKPANSGLSHAFVSDTATVGTDTALAATPGGLFRTRDGGESWTRVPGVEDVVTHIATNGGQRVYVGGNKGIRKSTDGGETWELVSPNIPTALAVPAASPRTVYAVFASAINNQDSMRRSTDEGRTWDFIGAGLSFDAGWFYYGMTPTVLEADEQDPSIAYLAYEAGLAKTDNAGDRWKNLISTSYPERVRAVAAKGPALHVGMSQGIFSSVDSGATWSAQRLLDERVQAIAMDPVHVRRSYAGTASGRVYRSDDSGNNWLLFSEGLEGAPVQRLAINDDGNRIYAATAGGMFAYQIVATFPFERLADDPLRLPLLMRQLPANGTGMTDGMRR